MMDDRNTESVGAQGNEYLSCDRSVIRMELIVMMMWDKIRPVLEDQGPDSFDAPCAQIYQISLCSLTNYLNTLEVQPNFWTYIIRIQK